MVRLAGVKAIRYIGDAPKKLWEVGGRNVPVLHRGDVVLVGETVGLSLVRGRFFIPVVGELSMEIEELEAVDNPPADLEELQDHLAGTEPLSDIELDTAFDAPVLDNVSEALAEVSEAAEPAKKKGK